MEKQYKNSIPGHICRTKIVFNPSLAKCPQSGTEFEDLRLIRIEQVAVMLGVKIGTVRGWMSKGTLPFRLWVREVVGPSLG
jgi:hypothetical protein